MPPGDWNYWNPVKEYVPTPSEHPNHTREPKNPFTDTIIYPPFPTSELDGPEREGGEVQDGDDEDEDEDEDGGDGDENNEDLRGPKNGANRKLIVKSDDPPSGPSGRSVGNPIVVSDSDEENELDERSEDGWDNEVIGTDESDGSNGNEARTSSEGDSDESEDSDVRRRMAIKKLPGT